MSRKMPSPSLVDLKVPKFMAKTEAGRVFKATDQRMSFILTSSVAAFL